MDPFDAFARPFGEAARMGALFELHLRAIAELKDETLPAAMKHRLEEVEVAVLKHYKDALSESDRAGITAARMVRNKLFHCEFWTAEKRVIKHSGPVATANTVHGKLETGEITALRDLDDNQPRIFGWVMEGAQSGGLFERADEIFSQAIVILRRLTLMASSDGDAP